MHSLPQRLSREISARFRVERNTLTRDVKDNPRDDIRIEIGDSKQEDFKPQLKIMRWDNEVNFSIRAEEHPSAIIEVSGGIIKYKTPNYEVHQYEIDAGGVGEDGGFEFEWVLPKMPSSNVLTATIETKGLDFFYQPELTQDEVDNGAYRPENVTGSYAVYHSTRGGVNLAGKMEYKAGKAFHIYRPKATDAGGNTVWGELNINQQLKNLTVTIDRHFLNNAIYPVVVDPTFGYTGVGGSGSFKLDDVRGSSGTPTDSGALTSVTTHIRSGWDAGEEQKMGVYNNSGIFLGVGYWTEELSSGGATGWYTFDFESPPAVTAGTEYLLALFQDDNIQYSFDTVSSYNSPSYDGTNIYPEFPSPVSVVTTLRFSIYATCTTGGGTSVKDILGSGLIPFAR